MELQELPDRISGEFRRDLMFLGATVAALLVVAGANNLATPDEPVRVGNVELVTECKGLELGVCLGVQQRDHITYNYDNYSDAEPGTENFYRRVESELMIQAYNICDPGTTGMEWLSEASYLNRTGEEWSSIEEVQLLPCEQTTWRNMTQG